MYRFAAFGCFTSEFAQVWRHIIKPYPGFSDESICIHLL